MQDKPLDQATLRGSMEEVAQKSIDKLNFDPCFGYDVLIKDLQERVAVLEKKVSALENK